MLSSSRRRTVSIRIGIVAATATTLALVVPGSASAVSTDQTYYVPVSKGLTINGHGFGHGHGMSQYGAEGAAKQGLGATQILSFYYPHTTSTTTGGYIRVLITADWTSDVIVVPRSGLSVRDLTDGAHWQLPSGPDLWRLTPATDGTTSVQYHDSTGWHRWQIPDGRGTFADDGEFYTPKGSPITLVLPGGDKVQYRGTLRCVRPYTGATVRDTVNVLGLDNYVRGVVAKEMPASWATAALQTQAVAARTYGAFLRAQNPTRYYQTCDTTACQVYGGYSAETDSSNNAVDATAHRILTYGGRPAFAQFSSSSGGWTAAGGQPYLPAQADPYDGWSGNPVHSWSVHVSATTLEADHPEIGRLKDVRVTSRDGHGEWGGRVEQIILDGTLGHAYMTGDDFRALYGLKSDWFSIAPTPIIIRWQKIGGDQSDVGDPRSGEFAVADGSAQIFQHGRIYWAATPGAHDLTGPILAAYRAWGGPSSSLGWPRSAVIKAGTGQKAHFQGGYIFLSDQTGAHVVDNQPILTAWNQQGGVNGWIGFPTSDTHAVSGGIEVDFQHAIITWYSQQGKTVIKKL